MSNTTDVTSETLVAVKEEGWRPILSWRAVLGGVAVALAVQIMLAILGSAIGLAFVDPMATSNPRPALVSLLAFMWWTLSGIIAAFAGGIVAGRLSGAIGEATAAWHGLVTWATTILIVFWVLSSAIGGAFGLLAGAASTASAEGGETLSPEVDPFASVATEIKDVTSASDPAAAREVVAEYVRAALTAESNSTAATERAAEALARTSGLPQQEASTRLAEWKAQYDSALAEAQAEAARAADTARRAASLAGLISVVALVFGALAGWLGGWHSTRPETLWRQRVLRPGF